MTTDTQLAPTDDEIDALWALLTGAAVASPSKFAREVLARWGQPAHSGEPVAWLDPWTGTKVTTDYDAYGKHGIPLYTAPQPVERGPLPVSQIRDWWASENGLEDCEMCKLTDFLRVVRAVEEKHGIKGGQHGAE